MANRVSYIPELFGGGHFVLCGRPLKLPDWVANTSNYEVKKNFIYCLINGSPGDLRYYFKAGENYVQIQKGIQESIKNAPYESFMKKIHIAVHVGATVVCFAVTVCILANAKL